MQNDLKVGVTRVVQSIYDRAGEVTAEQLVDAARPKDSPAHDAFEWNNAKAGDEYRLIQARRWIRIIVVDTPDHGRQGLVHVPIATAERATALTQAGVYKPAVAIVQNADEFQRALSSATQRLNAARDSVEELRRAIDASNHPDSVALIAQISRGLDILQSAVSTLH